MPVDIATQWREDWLSASVDNLTRVSSPTTWQPRIKLIHHTRTLLNCFRTEKDQGQCLANLHRWSFAKSPSENVAKNRPCTIHTVNTMSCQSPVSLWFPQVKFSLPVTLISFHTANSAFHPSGVSKWEPALAGKAKACTVHSDNGWTWGVQVKLWDPLRTHAIPERLGGVFTTRRYTNPRLPYLTLPSHTS